MARNLSLSIFATLFSLDAEFHCLQKQISVNDQRELLAYSNVFLWQDALDDFSDTAGLIAQLDLIISVDTAVAHLAAAMGKMTWILLPYNPDFRWLLTRTDSPWYNSVQLFRQGEDYNWQPIFTQIMQQFTQTFPIA